MGSQIDVRGADGAKELAKVSFGITPSDSLFVRRLESANCAWTTPRLRGGPSSLSQLANLSRWQSGTGVTPEFLALVALEKFTEDARATLSLVSGHSLVDRPCHECALNDACISAREPDRAACFL
jgi:hypothetical protein